MLKSNRSKSSCPEQSNAEMADARGLQMEAGDEHGDSTEEEKLFLTDGSSSELTDLAACFVRTTNGKSITEENVHKELSFATIHGGPLGLLISIERRLRLVYEPIFTSFLRDEALSELEKHAIHGLLIAVRSLQSSLEVGEKAFSKQPLLKPLSAKLNIRNEDGSYIHRDSYSLSILEKYTNTWIRQIEYVIIEGELLRSEKDMTEPHREIESWKMRASASESLISQINAQQVKNAIYCLKMANREIVKNWKRTCRRLYQTLLEARDVVFFLSYMEPHMHALVVHSPPTMEASLRRVFGMIRMVRLASNHYNTSERLTGIFMKITYQLINSSQRHILHRGYRQIWKSPTDEVLTSFNECLKLKSTYHKFLVDCIYDGDRHDSSGQNISEKYIMNKLEAFSRRIHELIEMFHYLSKYSRLFSSKLEVIDESISMFHQLTDDITNKEYSYIDVENKYFSKDLQEFHVGVGSLVLQVYNVLEKNFEKMWHTPQASLYLNKYLRVSSVITSINMKPKFEGVLHSFDQLLLKTELMYQTHREYPPVLRWQPPAAGRVSWTCMLASRLNAAMNALSRHEPIMLLPAAASLTRRHNSLVHCLVSYQHNTVTSWVKQEMSRFEHLLSLPILNQQSQLNDQIVRVQLESLHFKRIGFTIPDQLCGLLGQLEHYVAMKLKVERLMLELSSLKNELPEKLRELLQAEVEQVYSKIKSTLRTKLWTDSDLDQILTGCQQEAKSLRSFIFRLMDIMENRIELPLSKMAAIRVSESPNENEKLESFLDRNDRHRAISCEQLRILSEMIESGVCHFIQLLGTRVKLKTSSSLTHLQHDNNAECLKSRSRLSSVVMRPDQVKEPSDTNQQSVSDHLHLSDEPSVDVYTHYQALVVKTLVKVIRSSLELLRAVIQPSEVSELHQKLYVFSSELVVSGSSVVTCPSVDSLQESLQNLVKRCLLSAQCVPVWQPQRLQLLPNEDLSSDTASLSELTSLLVQERKEQEETSYYKFVSENKEIVKLMGYLSNCFKASQSNLASFIKTWNKFSYLWQTKDEVDLYEPIDSALTLDQHQNKLEQCLRKVQEVDQAPDMWLELPNLVKTDSLKNHLRSMAERGIEHQREVCRRQFCRTLHQLQQRLQLLHERLQAPVSSFEQAVAMMSVLRQIRQMDSTSEDTISNAEQSLQLLTRFGSKISPVELDSIDSARAQWQLVKRLGTSVQQKLAEAEPKFWLMLSEDIGRFEQGLEQFTENYRCVGPMEANLNPQAASDRVFSFQNRVDGLWKLHQMNTNGRLFLGVPLKEYRNLNEIRKELILLQKLYKLYNEVIDGVSDYEELLWNEINIEEINNQLSEFQNRCRKLPKALKEWPAFFALKKTIDDFGDLIPLVELMSNKAMKQRHWSRLDEITSFTFDVEDPGFRLKHALEAPLLKFKEDIEDVCISAMKERDIEAKLRVVTTQWSTQELKFTTFKSRGELLLRGDCTADAISELDESVMVLGSLMSNRYNLPFKKQIQKWLSDLVKTNEVLEQWLFVQNLWVYLEAVFVGGDIAKQMPQEARRFYTLDRNWQRLMHRAHETTNVVACCAGDDTLSQQLPQLQTQLEVCQKSLSGYLEKKRELFPRFYFVSDSALLEILGQASDSHTVQSHLLSIFDNTKRVVFHDSDYDKIVAIVSSEGETINLESVVAAEDSVEVWLMKLLTVAQQSLHAVIRQSHYILQDPSVNVTNFVESFPSQVGILGVQMIWTRDAEIALLQCRYDKRIMRETNNRFLELLNTLIDKTTADLSAIERAKYETLVTVHVHQRDIFDQLYRHQVKSVSDFEWTKQCRFYFKDDSDETAVCITDVHFVYQNEFLGCTDRLVITPLTDRCYITLAQALQISMGGCPNGPAGTGKTETVKDMAKSLGKYVVVFNCSDQLDYRGLGKIIKGLAQSGSWGCFDEFNRILLPVLSVASQQISVTLSAKKERRKSLIFTDGSSISLNPQFGIFITMNPSYAGRQQLPENMKINFRNVAMMIPDRQIIIRVKLASCGFLENITLARKFFSLYKLCEDQLSRQRHYDFGLRNILSVLRTLGNVKRSNKTENESSIVMQVLRDMNLSKLIDEDEPLFLSLIKDLFPNVGVEKIGHPQLEATLNLHLASSKLTAHKPWTMKIMQLYETQLVRHGIMVLGPSGSGKSTCIRLLLKSLSDNTTTYRELRLNPKSITVSQMFGRLDIATNDWTDGIFSSLWRRSMKPKKGEVIWLVLDGPVDPVWIENLNSVLDDNRTLTLANGDRLPLNPACKIIFEPENIDQASPATVSRNGMVYMSSSGLPWLAIFHTWTAKQEHLGANWIVCLKELFESSFSALYQWTEYNLKFTTRILQINIITQMLFLLETLLSNRTRAWRCEGSSVRQRSGEPDHDSMGASDDEQVDAAAPPTTEEGSQRILRNFIERVYVFALVWSLGAALETDNRLRLEKRIKSFHFENVWPAMKAKESIFDYYVNEKGNWQHWSEKVVDFIYPEISSPEHLSIIIDTVDKARVDYLVSLAVGASKPILLLGQPGTSKSSIMKHIVSKLSDEHISRNLLFSSATKPLNCQRILERLLDKQVGVTYGPSSGRKMTIIIDDVHMPSVNQWGDQEANEWLRQTLEMQGFYSLEKPGDFVNIVNVNFFATASHPGGGMNELPTRLKRHFLLVNCPMPSSLSLDRIFGTIAVGHFSAKRGFLEPVRELVRKLVPLTRKLWQNIRANFLPTPANFHYLFTMKELSRVWQGMVATLSSVVDSEHGLLKLWQHECTRVFADRFTTKEDSENFASEMNKLCSKYLGQGFSSALQDPVHFVDFLRDAPEPTGEDSEDADMEMPKIYEPVQSFPVLKERLDMFLFQYNDMARSGGIDLVFFEDAMIHLIRISRILRNAGGNALLVGVGGSGKRSLTSLAAFIAGYKMFAPNIIKSYTINNFLDELKAVYRFCGAQGKPAVLFINEQDLREEVFLEYLNNVICSVSIITLFNRDEMQEVCSELMPMMKRDPNQPDINSESLQNYFYNRVRQNLHVVIGFSPVGEKFRSRALQYPGVVSNCTIDWFHAWPKTALLVVAQHYLSSFEVTPSSGDIGCVIGVIGNIHDSLNHYCTSYFETYRRLTHVTPKMYLKLLKAFRQWYSRKQTEIQSSASHLELGLARLEETSLAVIDLTKQLSQTELDLEQASKEAAEVLEEVTRRTNDTSEVRDRLLHVKNAAASLVDCIETDKALAAEKLKLAEPALLEAEEALNTIKPSHIATVRKLGRPPHLVMRIMDCVLLLFKKRLQSVRPDPQLRCPKPSWVESLKMMASTSFLQQLQNFPKDTMNDEIVELLEPYFSMTDYNMEVAQRVCGDVAGLLSWTRSMTVFHGVNKEVWPLKMNLSSLETKLAEAQVELSNAEDHLKLKERDLTEAKEQYGEALTKRTSLSDNALRCGAKMRRAKELIDGLSGEKLRWMEQNRLCHSLLSRLAGDTIMAVSFLAYAGPFNQKYRQLLQNHWRNLLMQSSLPSSENLRLADFLCDNSTLSEWTLNGLPEDDLSVENALIATRSHCFPLLIDPQGQANAWIKANEGAKQLQVITMNDQCFQDRVEESLSYGRPMLIEDVGEELSHLLNNLLEKKFVRTGSTLKVILGDKECDVMSGFYLYITTKLPNPRYSPDVASKVVIVDFTVTCEGLEPQLLGRVVRSERRDLEQSRVAMITDMMNNKRKVKQLQDSLLHRLTSSQVSLVDDEELVAALHSTEKTTKEIHENMKSANIAEENINKAREKFRPVAARGTILYFLLTDLSRMNFMYQTSLVQFFRLFDKSLSRPDNEGSGSDRIEGIIEAMTLAAWQYGTRSVYKEHKLIFTLLMAIKTDLHAARLTYEEYQIFIKGGASLDMKTVAAKPFTWISDVVWLNLVHLSHLPAFVAILDQISEKEKEWHGWIECPNPESSNLPGGYSHTLTEFQKLLLIRCWCPDRTLVQAEKYIAETLGHTYCQEQILELKTVWAESELDTPLLCLLSTGADPSKQILELAKSLKKECLTLSMGQNQEEPALQMMQHSLLSGDWVLLQNFHLSLSFYYEMKNLIDRTDSVHKEHRLWITTEEHPDFPIGLLQTSIRFTNEPPRGVAAILRRALLSLHPDLMEHSTASQWPQLVYAVVFLHTVLQERHKFAATGWNLRYEFNQADLNASLQFLQNHFDGIDNKKGVSWPAVCYMLGEIHYGGRVTDDFDKRLLQTYCKTWFSDKLLRANFSFFQEYRIPSCKTVQQFSDYVTTLPSFDNPQLFGLHPNAEITCQVSNVQAVFDTMLTIQSEESATSAGETRESAVNRLCLEMLCKIPTDFDHSQVQHYLQNNGHNLPMTIFLRQELNRLQAVITMVRKTMNEVVLAVGGTIVLSPSLKLTLNAMYDAKTPPNWQEVSWESGSIGFWFNVMLERYSQLQHWVTKGKPNAFWVTGFFNPQGFFTAMRQEVTRAHRGWALDSVVMQNTVTSMSLEQVTSPAAEGVYVYGLYLEGASLDKKTRKLVECHPKVLYEVMPVIYMYAISSTCGKDSRLYECPIYRKPMRAERNYVGSADFETDISPSHWVLRAVALLGDIK